MTMAKMGVRLEMTVTGECSVHYKTFVSGRTYTTGCSAVEMRSNLNNKTTAKAKWGTNEEREQGRRRETGALRRTPKALIYKRQEGVGV